MSNQHLAARFMVELTQLDQAIFRRIGVAGRAYHTAFLADVLVMNARSRIAASPAYKELIIERARRMFTQGELNRATFRNR